jgi:spore maturation protein CgeB
MNQRRFEEFQGMADAAPLKSEPPLRILSSCTTWQGGTDYGLLCALRRAGHSVVNLPPTDFDPPGWRSFGMRAMRRMLAARTNAEYRAALIEAAHALQPHLFLVYKGAQVDADTIKAIRSVGAFAVNVFPDFSFTIHGRTLPKALPHYDWIFTTKSFGVDDFARLLHMTRASYLPHCYDPLTHFPATLAEDEAGIFKCDAAFIGSHSRKKETLLAAVLQRLPQLNLVIWGDRWEKTQGPLARAIRRRTIVGREYAKAVTGASINIALLSEACGDASSGDRSTTRTFEIPAIGGFMLHERTLEAQGLFAEGGECDMFDDADELAQKILYWLARPEARARIAAAGHARCLASGYDADTRAAEIIAASRAMMKARA